jgi:hypothetical protein
MRHAISPIVPSAAMGVKISPLPAASASPIDGERTVSDSLRAKRIQTRSVIGYQTEALALSGYSVGVENDTLSLNTPRIGYRIGFEDIHKIVIQQRIHSALTGLAGYMAFAGIFAGI